MLKSAKTDVNVIAHQLFGRQKKESAVNFFKKSKGIDYRNCLLSLGFCNFTAKNQTIYKYEDK
jgi:hypothetical protein